jgi:hypothetical protein
MICRAAEAEHMMEALLVDLDPATEPKKVRGLPAGNTRKRVIAKADQWPGQRDQIRNVVEVMETTSTVRNWLVHAWVLASPTGEWVELQKAEKDSAHWGRRRITYSEIDQLAARFAWVVGAVTRLHNERDSEDHGSHALFADPLPPPAPLPECVVLT